MKHLRTTLIVVGIFQIFFGLLFLLAPGPAASMFGLEPDAPAWANWLFAMMAARFLGYGYGMFVAARDPLGRVAWIDTMIAIQAIDWLATLGYLISGDLTLAQVTTAAVAPPLFIAALLAFHPRRAGVAAARAVPLTQAR
ncbi:MAG: hypothetical protein ABIS44_09960 [Mycobacteriales bacterium]